MKNIALAAMLALTLCGRSQASLLEIVPERETVAAGAAAGPPNGVVVLQSSSSDLAEPAVVAMMLLGLCLIGYKASRESSEKFE